jgi:hypothetical protein
MPCKPRKARLLLKEGKAKVIKRTPFTIQLLYGSSGYKQKINLGVDAGSKIIGLSATTYKKELFSSEVILRDDIVKFPYVVCKLNSNEIETFKKYYQKKGALNFEGIWFRDQQDINKEQSGWKNEFDKL